MRLLLATMLWHFDFELEGVHDFGKGAFKDSPEAR
jgi:hypothetical protein